MESDEDSDLELSLEMACRGVLDDDSGGGGVSSDTDYEDAEEIEMPDLVPEDEFDEEERNCWICLLRESENPLAHWVTPCKCSGTMGHVHQDCIKRWVEEKQGGNFNEDVICPQCNTRYAFFFPEKGLLLQLLNVSNELTKGAVKLVIIGGVVGAVYMVTTFYTRNVLRVIFSKDNNALFMKDGECLTLDPYFEIFVNHLRGFLRKYGLDAQSLAERNQLSIRLLRDIRIIHTQNQKLLWSLKGWTTFMIPYYTLFARSFSWDEWLLAKIDKYEQITIKCNQTTASCRSRTIVGGLLMPFMANAVGRFLYSDQPPLKRWLLGAGTYLTVKGAVTLVRKYKIRRWNHQRQVKDYEEEDENAEDSNQGRRRVEIEINGENWLGFRW